MRYVPQLRRKHTSLYAVLKLSIFKTMNACNVVVERATRRPYTPSVGSVAIKHSSMWCRDVLVFTVTRKLFFLNFCLELGGPWTWGPMDFAHTAHPIVTPLIGPLVAGSVYRCCYISRIWRTQSTYSSITFPFCPHCSASLQSSSRESSVCCYAD